MTNGNPLQTCQPVQFVLQFPLGATPGSTIWLHMTDQNHNNLGYVVSQRVGMQSGGAASRPASFCLTGVERQHGPVGGWYAETNKK